MLPFLYLSPVCAFDARLAERTKKQVRKMKRRRRKKTRTMQKQVQAAKGKPTMKETTTRAKLQRRPMSKRLCSACTFTRFFFQSCSTPSGPVCGTQSQSRLVSLPSGASTLQNGCNLFPYAHCNRNEGYSQIASSLCNLGTFSPTSARLKFKAHHVRPVNR